MTDSRGSGGETSVPNSGSAEFAPFEVWSEWLRNNMGAMSASPGSNREEAVPEGAPPSDSLMSAMGKLSDANPMSNIIPIDWMEISKALQTLHERQKSDPQRTMQVAADYNRRLEEAMVKVWNDAPSRFSGLPRQQEEEEEEKGKPDKRFSDPEWESNPYYKMLKETYLLTSEYILKEAEETDDGQDTEEQRSLKFHLKQFVDAMAPVNFFLTNPTAIKRAMETGGTSLANGARNLASDLEQGRLSMVDSEAFEVGENLATTPGKVVYRNELIELIQYEPQTERVHEVPLLFLPPWINKYYILDLSEKNSLVKYLVEQGFTVFMTSWKNPDSSMDETKFEDYMTLGPLKAVDVALEITGAEKVNPVGYCIGGTLLIITLAWLAAGDDEEEKQKFGHPTFMVSLQDYSEVGDTEVFMDEPQVESMEMQMMERGYLDDRKMANMFNVLRSSELIWSNVINNYLLGQKPPALDMLYWNSDGTRMARDAHSLYIRNTYLENNLIKPGKVELMGRPIDLGRIKTGDVYAVGAEKDHIVPWKSAWKISKLANTNATHFTLAASGHIAGMIAPPEKGKGYWTGEDGQYETAEKWRENAEEHEGTWWEDWRGWLEQRSGEQTDPPQVGSEQYPPIEDAPGTYVRETSSEIVREAGQEGAQVAQESVGAYIFSCSESAARQIRTYHRRKGAKVQAMEHWSLKRRAQLPGGEIAFDVFGSGPPMILVHGTPSWSYIWRKVVPVLSDRFTVYVFDLLGYGDSEASEGQDVSIAVHARVLTQLVDRWGLEVPAVAGHDIGGATVLRAHLLERVPFSRMALIDAVALRPWVTEASQHVQRHLEAYRTMPNHIFEEVVAAHLRTTVSRPMDEETFNVYIAPWRGPEGQEAYLRKVERFDEQHTKEFEPLLGSIRVPVRIIWGEEDAWLAPAFARELQELVPGSGLHLIPGAGHFSMEDRPDIVARELADFFG